MTTALRPHPSLASRGNEPTRVNETSVVAVILEHHGRIALLKRSQAVRHDRGRWHCVTGYLEPGLSPQEQALTEVFEETGLRLVDLTDLQPGRTLVLLDDSDHLWRIHTFKAVTTRRHLTINWEHAHYRWTPLARVKRFDGQVSWLGRVVDAVYAQGQSVANPASEPVRERKPS